VSTWKKSQASSPCACICRNARHDVPAFRGAGLCRWARRIRRTVDALMVTEPAQLAVHPAVALGRVLTR
jgi:hypothetical protein